MLSVKKQIEKRKNRLSVLAQHGRISRSYANGRLKEFAQFVSEYYGCGAKLFNNISATKMLFLVIATFWALS